MWGGVLSLVRQGLRRRRRSTAQVADESATTAAGGGDVAGAAREATPGVPLARAVLAMARGAVVGGLDDGGTEEAWAAASGWRPARAADEVRHLVARRESLRYVIYA